MLWLLLPVLILVRGESQALSIAGSLLRMTVDPVGGAISLFKKVKRKHLRSLEKVLDE
jgi:hypothetical protein